MMVTWANIKVKKTVGTQTDISCERVTVQTSNCRECLSLAFGVEDDVYETCVRCEQVSDPLSVVTGLKVYMGM